MLKQQRRPRTDEELDFLMELTTHPGWRVLRRERDRFLESYQSQLRRPSETEFDLIKKETITAAILALERFFLAVEEKAERYAKGMRDNVT